MNGSKELVSKIAKWSADFPQAGVDLVIAPPALYVNELKASLKNAEVALQNVSDKPSGAYTGELAVGMMEEMGIKWAIIGHSERRNYYGETSEEVGRKLAAIMASQSACAILCVGETLEEREAGQTEEVVKEQLSIALDQVKDLDVDRLVVAYEPVWAIGTGKVATAQQAQAVHDYLRAFLSGRLRNDKAEAIRIIYGGSVTGGNCSELIACPDIDGFLVGGASLKPEFSDIIKACL